MPSSRLLKKKLRHMRHATRTRSTRRTGYAHICYLRTSASLAFVPFKLGGLSPEPGSGGDEQASPDDASPEPHSSATGAPVSKMMITSTPARTRKTTAPIAAAIFLCALTHLITFPERGSPPPPPLLPPSSALLLESVCSPAIIPAIALRAKRGE